jgi:DNA (cytosine-5)-methyltransferase 1
MGYYWAGFDIVGVDIVDQPHYPFPFVHADALDILTDRAFMESFRYAHASPPCQHYSWSTPTYARDNHPDLIATWRTLLLQYPGMRFVIENVNGARFALNRPAKLCGTMFGLIGTHHASGLQMYLQRHRYFEANFRLDPPILDCRVQHIYHGPITGTLAGKGGGWSKGGAYSVSTAEARELTGVTWAMRRRELSECIPPAYTEWVGKQMLCAS